MSKLIDAVNHIKGTLPGQERNMYPDVLTIFTELEHNRKHIKVDTASESASGIPDLYVMADVGNGIVGEWLVCEVKDEIDAFSTPAKREKIFSEKAKYISIDTAFFVMIDPSCMVIRPVVARSQKQFDPSKDIVVNWDDVVINGKDWFLERTTAIQAKNSGYRASLQAFREGDTDLIAFIDINVSNPTAPQHTQKRYEYARNDFYDAVRKSTQMLQDACLTALEELKPEIDNFDNELKCFSQKFDGYEITINPFSLKGKKLSSETAQEHDLLVKKIKNMVAANPSIGKLAISWLPDFVKRVGKVEYNKKDLTYELFATETANMILARVLLLRFFEDHGFFGEKRYICNGGVKSFQNMREYFDLSYTKLLKDVYDKAKSIYINVFDEMELDWIFGSSNEKLSLAIELSLMHLSRFNFQTVKGDILTGIYDRFMSGSKRKRMGEYFTPPSVARYIIDRLQINAEHKVLDPSCGSGTFPIEVFEKTAGELIANGLGDYTLAEKSLSNIAGNDLNPFSAMLTQIQLLWHILPLKDELKKHGFPSIRVSEKHNSLIPSETNGFSFDASWDLFTSINSDQYDFVIGNPPYVRPERSDQQLTSAQARYYEQDITVDKNLFTLFIYRGLRSWCKPNGDGTLAFVVPISFCDNNSNQTLRDLFIIGGKWRITEILDMEAISDHVFDASVNPIILIANSRPATQDDRVCIRVAGSECVNSLGQIDLTKSTESIFKYEDIWSHDGRILTKITDERLNIIKKIGGDKTFGSIAYRFWQRKQGAAIVDWQKDEPEDLQGWNQRVCITRGAVFRGSKPNKTNGFDVYKGENVSACLIEGNPVETNIDIQNVDDASLWRFIDVMPDKTFAFLRISSGLNAVSFNMHKTAFLDTVTLFVPNENYKNFPFDILVLSNVYQYYYATYLRMGVVEEFWSNVYPTNLEMLPWSDNLANTEQHLDSLRQPFLETCQAIFNRGNTLQNELDKLGAVTFQSYLSNLYSKGNKVKVNWNCLEQSGSSVQLKTINSYSLNEKVTPYTIRLADDLFTWIEVDDLDTAKKLALALTIHSGCEITREDILQMPIPKDDDAYRDFFAFTENYDNGNALGKLEMIIGDIDAKVASSFNLSDQELAFIRQEMKYDTFLKNIKPSLPFTGKKKKGLLSKLGSSDRYA